MSRFRALAGRLGTPALQVKDVVPEDRNRELDEKIREKNRRLKNLRQRLAERDKELEDLRRQLARAEGARAPGSSPAGMPVFFVVGVPKSGTSWLMRLLNSHPQILCKGEGVFFGKGSRSLLRALESSEGVRRWVERSPWTRTPKDPKLNEIAGMLARALMLRKLGRAQRHFPTKLIVGDKSPYTESTVADLLQNVPNARVIHIIRDGRDQAISLVHHRWNRAEKLKISVEEKDKLKRYRENPQAFGKEGESIFGGPLLKETAAMWSRTVSEARAEGRQDPERYAEVLYEDLLSNPVEEMRRLLAFLGADASEGVAAQCVRQNTFERVAGRESGEEDSTSFYRKGVAGDWRRIFTPADREVYRSEASEVLAELGYAPC